MENTLHLSNQYLDVEIRLPGSTPESERFDACAQIQQVVLNGRHRFCQPEQLRPERVTCHGIGLCSEFVMDSVGEKVRAGELFPKFGVGQMRQIRDFLPYDMWSHYEISRFSTHWRHGEDWIEFEEEPETCLGMAARILRRVQLFSNTLSVSTTIINTGREPLDFFEYQHNFVSIDDLPAGPGYVLEIPYDGTISDLERSFRNLADLTPTDASCVKVEGQQIRWTQSLDGYTYHKVTEAEDILPQSMYKWTLRHSGSPVSISEISHFQPQRIVLWGIEHCICTEVYHRIQAAPGSSHHFSRTWIFRDDRTQEA
ncbi:MAG: hypothetical protein Q4G06_08065 [Clostridia bacterium]|nr:hypothetical protein [Clostridia bacterium]